MVIVKWHGHACVEIVKNDGYVIVIDPHDGGSIGLKKPDVKADLVLVTHEHFDHNSVETVSKESTRVLRVFHGETIIDSIVVRGYKTYHDKNEGRRRGINTIYYLLINSFKIVHLGDLGHIPSDELINEIHGVDLLIIPVGGTYTIYPDEAWRIIEIAKPVNVLPIHYWIRGLTLPLFSIEEFLPYVKEYEVIRLETNSFDLSKFHNSIIIPSV
ncbi:MAG: MBL fold metallo-hydrolase [Desulfurococcaceae archaeon]|uniref:Zn-dependent hydrolase n=1 Tax=Staphylothermus marinus TaxID=2280 RepID=A0A7C4H6T1_STAMA